MYSLFCADALYDTAVKRGDLSFYGLSVLALLVAAPSSWELSCQKHAVVFPTKLARVAKAPRAAILRGLKELQASGDVDVITVTGQKQKNHTFAVRLLSPDEILALVEARSAEKAI